MNKLFVFIMASMLMVGVVAATPSSPMPIAIKVIMNNPGDAIGIDVIVRDMTHPFTMILKTNEYAEAINDWGNAGVKGSIGDVFEIEVKGKTVTQTMQDSGLGGGVVFVNLADENCPVLPKDTTPYDEFTCPQKEVIKEIPAKCPILECSPVTCQAIECPTVDCEKECIPADCPKEDDTFKIIISIIGSLMVGTGIGLSIYRDGKTGKLIFSIKSHRHEGRTSLHSIYTVHRVPYTHGYGEPVPVYKDGKYIPNPDYPMK
ncbi:MAG: hypothetical protein ABIH42_05300 [Planctomycetota bacterium]